MHQDNLDMINRTVVDNMLPIFFAGTAMSVAVVITACAEHNGGCTVDDDETRYLLGLCKPYHIEVSRTQNIQAEVSVRKFGLNVLPPIAFHMVTPGTV